MNRRRKQFILPDLQLRVAFLVLFVAILALLINFQMSLTTIWNLTEKASPALENTLDQVHHKLVIKFLITVVLTVPLALLAGILFSFKFAGPLYKIKKYFTEIANSRWDQRLLLRKGDDLLDICDAINDGLDELRSRIRKGHQFHREIRNLLEELGPTLEDHFKGRAEILMETIEQEECVWQDRFPSEKDVEQSSSGQGESQKLIDLV